MRTKRITDSDFETDEAERIWWNTNAGLIEKIWAQGIDMQRAIRSPYLKKMKAFILKNAVASPVKILEIGCGSGWVCRLVADKGFHVIGTDFSEGQLAIANDMAKVFNKENYCSYELADASSFKKEVDGVVIHALLHHLSSTELQHFFEQFAQLKTGTKIFVYEPIFFARQEGKASFMDKLLNIFIKTIRSVSFNLAAITGKKNTSLADAMNKINKDAEENGWYISPKEIPFAPGELENYFSPLCTMQNKYIVNKTDLDIAQNLTMNGIDKPGFVFSKIMIPLACWLDRLSFKGKFTHFLNPYQHLFVCFEWIKK
jgi:2-polyprenyl-3-methyl-5-hydroxy-6-metoxy-1,4-benzoquinol methylase